MVYRNLKLLISMPSPVKVLQHAFTSTDLFEVSCYQLNDSLCVGGVIRCAIFLLDGNCGR